MLSFSWSNVLPYLLLVLTAADVSVAGGPAVGLTLSFDPTTPVSRVRTDQQTTVTVYAGFDWPGATMDALTFAFDASSASAVELEAVRSGSASLTASVSSSSGSTTYIEVSPSPSCAVVAGYESSVVEIDIRVSGTDDVLIRAFDGASTGFFSTCASDTFEIVAVGDPVLLVTDAVGIGQTDASWSALKRDSLTRGR